MAEKGQGLGHNLLVTEHQERNEGFSIRVVAAVRVSSKYGLAVVVHVGPNYGVEDKAGVMCMVCPVHVAHAEPAAGIAARLCAGPRARARRQ